MELLVSRYLAYSTEESTAPAANGVMVRSMSFTLQTTCGIGSASAFNATEVFASLHVVSLPLL